MPVRIYLCPVIGSGTEDDPQRAAVGDNPKVTACRACIAVDPMTGFKTLGWTVCRVVASNFVGVDAVKGAVHIPKAALDGAVSGAVKAKLDTELKGDAVLSAGDTTRTVIRKLVQAHYPHADEKGML